MALHLQPASEECLRIQIDDGNLNVLELSVVTELLDLLESANEDDRIRCVILSGNDKALSVGLDTETILGGGQDAEDLLSKMGRILDLLYTSSLISITIAMGHATASGAMLLLASDYRIAVAGHGKIGLSEVSVGLAVPSAVQQMVRDRIATQHQYAVTALATLSDVQEAASMGFLDHIVNTEAEALSLAESIVSRSRNLHTNAYWQTKRAMRAQYVVMRDIE